MKLKLRGGLASKIRFNRLFTVYFISFSLVIILPVYIVGIASYQFVLGKMEEQLSQSQLIELKQMSISLNQTLHDIHNLSTVVALDGNIYGYLQNEDDQYALNNIRDTAKTLASTSEFIQGISIYKSNSRQIISSNELTRRYAGEERDKWIESIQRANAANVWIFAPDTPNIKNRDGSKENIITFARKFPFVSGEDYGYIAIHVYEKEISALISKLQMNPFTNIYVVDDQGETLASHMSRQTDGGMTAERINRLPGSDQEGYFVDSGNGPNTLIGYSKSFRNGWVIVSETPLDYLLDKLSPIRNMTIGICLLLTFAGLATAYLLSRSIYNPIKMIIDKSKNIIHHLGGGTGFEQGNEFQFVTGVLDSVFLQNKQLIESFRDSIPAQADRFLFSLLHNNVGSIREAEDKINFLQLDLSTSQSVIVVIEIDQYTDLLKNYSIRDVNLFKFAVRNIAEEVIRAQYTCLSAEVSENQIAVLANPETEWELAKPQINLLCEQIQESVHRLLKLRVSISVGQSYDHILLAYLSFTEATDVLKYKLHLGERQILFFEDVQADRDIDYYYPLQLEKQLCNCILTGNASGMHECLEQLKRDITEREHLSYENLYRIYTRLLDAAIAILVDSGGSIKQLFGEQYHIYKELAGCESLHEIHSWIGSVFDRIANYVSQIPRANKTIERVLQYIEDHYGDFALSVEAIADVVDLHPNYLSRLFKQEYGKTMVEYIGLRRLEASKQLLADSGLSVQEIARKVGYNNINSYIRFFKKNEGITPGEFRKINGINGRENELSLKSGV